MSKIAQLPSQEDDWTLRKEEKRRKKEAKRKEAQETKHAETDVEDAEKPAKKRKRELIPEEIEVDVNLPEPPSKKAARKAKKVKSKPSTDDADESSSEAKPKEQQSEGDTAVAKRSEYGVWIGNLPWSATKDSLRAFIIENTEILEEQITRVHMPAPTKPPNPNWTTKPLNKGFAYVDFTTELAMYSAIAMTETKMDGRPLLIKNAKSFEGRPEKPKDEESSKSEKDGKGGNPPNKRVFVGNLPFEMTRDDLEQHYGQCGEIALTHMATFEDTGKCKGYAWITFETVEAASSAVKGFFYKDVEVKKKGKKGAINSDDEDAKETKKRKWLVSKFMGRELRCEFAEDATTRYNKRYGKEKQADIEGVHPDRVKHLAGEEGVQRSRQNKDLREKRPPRKVDPRTIKSGAAHTNALRGPQGIVKAEGKKITFD